MTFVTCDVSDVSDVPVVCGRDGGKFRVYVIIPLLPGFEGQVGTAGGTAIQAITHWNYSSICRWVTSLLPDTGSHGSVYRHGGHTGVTGSYYRSHRVIQELHGVIQELHGVVQGSHGVIQGSHGIIQGPYRGHTGVIRGPHWIIQGPYRGHTAYRSHSGTTPTRVIQESRGLIQGPHGSCMSHTRYHGVT